MVWNSQSKTEMVKKLLQTSDYCLKEHIFFKISALDILKKRQPKLSQKYPVKKQNGPLPGCIKGDFVIPMELPFRDKDTKYKVTLVGRQPR